MDYGVWTFFQNYFYEGVHSAHYSYLIRCIPFIQINILNHRTSIAYEYCLYWQALWRQWVCKDPIDFLHIADDELIRNYQFPCNEIINLILEFEPQLERNNLRILRYHAIPVSTQIVVALQFYASGI